jgi:hypothetical protein
MKDAAPLFGAPMADPLFDTCSSALLRGFATCPQVRQVTDAPERLLQLASTTVTRSSATPKRSRCSRRRRAGHFPGVRMGPVFFGQALAGDRLPNLTYMLGFADKAAKEAAVEELHQPSGLEGAEGGPAIQGHGEQDHQHPAAPSQGSQL